VIAAHARGATAIAAEGFAATWRGRVEEIPPNVVGRKLKPQDPGKPTDARVLLVRIALPPGTPLKLGQRVEVQVDASRIAATASSTVGPG
jgi:hypothetical protein